MKRSHATTLAMLALLLTTHLAQAQSNPTLRPDTGADPFVGLEPDSSAPTPSGAAVQLWALTAAVDDWRDQSVVLAQLAAAERERLSAAARALAGARRDYGGEHVLARVYTQLQDADVQLSQVAANRAHPQHQTVQGLRGQLGTLTRQLTLQLLEVAEAGGADTADLNVWRANFGSANAALDLGQHQVALRQYSQLGQIVSGGLQFDVDRFEQALRDSMSGQAVGYSYAIVRNGLLHAADGVGLSRKPGTAQSETKPMYIASLSKTVSTLAMLRTLQNFGISPDASIAGYLPSYWSKHASINQITFRHLLSHRSGLDVTAANGAALGLTGGVSGQSVATLRSVIAAGIQNANLLDEGDATPYINANFALIRVLVPRMTFGEPYLVGFMDPAKSNEDTVYSAFYSQLASAFVLQPTGMAPTSCGPREVLQTQTLYYSTQNNDVGDLRNHAIGGNFQRVCGATGFYLSAVEMAGVLAYRRHSNAIIGNSMRNAMDGSFLGWLNPVSFANNVTGDFGTYRAHGGDSATGGATPGMAGCMMDFPIHLQAVLLINSRGGPGGAASCSLLRDAYDGAWVYP